MAVTKGAVDGPVVSWLGISLPELACFLAFWAAQVRLGVEHNLPAHLRCDVYRLGPEGFWTRRLHPRVVWVLAVACWETVNYRKQVILQRVLRLPYYEFLSRGNVPSLASRSHHSVY